MNETKIVSASVRVSLSHNYNTFEVVLNIENENGLNIDEVNKFRLEAHELAKEAVEDYKSTQVVENPGRQIKKDNISISDIESLPLYDEIKKLKAEQKLNKNAKH